MEKLQKIRKDLRIICDATRDDILRHDYFVADIHLERFERELERSTQHRMLKIQVRMLRDGTEGHPVLRDSPIPCLFVNGHPVKRLMMYNILCRINQIELNSFLIEKGCTNFRIEKIKTKPRSSTAVLVCDNLASSTEIQVLACNKELLYTYQNGKTSYFRTRPDDNCFYNDVELAVAPNTFHLELLPDNLQKFVGCSAIIEKITNLLNTEEFFNFYEAFHKPQIFNNQPINFESSSPRYQTKDGLAVMIEDAKYFKFNKIEFADHIYPISPTSVMKILGHTLRIGMMPYTRCCVKEINLKDIISTETLIDFMSQNFKTFKLTLGSTTSNAEKLLIMRNLKEFTVIKNHEFNFYAFTKENYEYLKILKIVNCKTLKMKNCLNFVRGNGALKEFYFINSQATDINPCDLVEAVLSGENEVEIFNFSFSPDFIPTLTDMSPPNAKLSRHIKTLNLNFNTHVTNFINAILLQTPALQNLHILGLDISYEIRTVSAIKTLELNYNLLINRTLNNLDLSQLSRLCIINNFGKKRTKPLDTSHIFRAFDVTKKLDFEYTKCKLP